ncbi:MAG TPA: hypothetical protein VM509_14145, partial [Planctomycetota bacterium]|nr:hypothetical protein [Planctomycetota bacterium]
MVRVEPFWSLLLATAVGAAACSPDEPAAPRGLGDADEPKLTTAPDPGVDRDPTPRASPSQRPPPRRGIAGIAGFQSNSRLVYASKPDEPHQLSAVYLYPGRMRMRLSLDRGKIVERVLLYQFGEQGFCVDERESSS